MTASDGTASDAMAGSQLYSTVKIATDRVCSEALETLLFECGALACSFTDAADNPILEPLPGETPLWQELILTATFERTADVSLVAALAVNRFDSISPADVQVAELADQAWERVWMDSFQPIKISQTLWVVPSFCKPPDADAVNLIIDPGLAFGSGTHPTTLLCLRWLAVADLRGKTVIDYGCGSGILAVAAAMLGAARVEAFDIDPQALSATADNAAANRVDTLVNIVESHQQLSSGCDVLVANILLRPLLDLRTAFSGLVVAGGTIGLSGLLAEQLPEIERAYPGSFRSAGTAIEEEWALWSGVKPFAC